MIAFALNQITVRHAPFGAFAELAARLGCIGVEMRNDLDRPLFDGIKPAEAGQRLGQMGLRLLGLSQVYPFNDWSAETETSVRSLIAQAVEAGAETISLIPRNDGLQTEETERRANLRQALDHIVPLLDDTGMVALIEPLGFSTASLRLKSEVVAEIEGLGAEGRVKLVHDKFHHTLAGDDIYAEQTGIVHISAVTDTTLAMDALQDKDRGLVDARDRLGNVAQIAALQSAGYDGAVSFECFAPEVHALNEPEPALRRSMNFISSQLRAQAA